MRELIGFRWGAVVGQLAVLLAGWLCFRLQITPLPGLLLIGFLAASNLGLSIGAPWIEHYAERVIKTVILVDLLLLFLMLYFYGGNANPFSIMFIVHVTIAASLLSTAWTWLVVVLSTFLFALLFVAHVPVLELEGHHGAAAGFSLHLQGMLAAFFCVASLLGYFLSKMSQSLKLSEEQRSRDGKLLALTTLAAGAAHELNTPLATIALISSELERDLEHVWRPERVHADLKLIRSEVGRCESILKNLRGKCGAEVGEFPSQISMHSILELLASRLAQEGLEHAVELEVVSAPSTLALPIEGLLSSLCAVIKNGYEAAERCRPVRLSISEQDNFVHFLVKDFGHGMSAEVLSHLGEPFFSTKGAGVGVGLGVFLARIFAHRLGGSLDFRSELEHGTEVLIKLPCSISWNEAKQAAHPQAGFLPAAAVS
ncbi:MAG: hypothetical protein K1X83_10310 [Oligoflexia bacterium]|nr:hypothetical protein [Oligoflexia bacterium]